jgi:hypothetical protein
MFTKKSELVLGNSRVNKKPKRAKRATKTVKQTKRKLKKYVYARTQNLFKENPGTLARYIREDINWTNGQDLRPSPQDVETL